MKSEEEAMIRITRTSENFKLFTGISEREQEPLVGLVVPGASEDEIGLNEWAADFMRQYNPPFSFCGIATETLCRELEGYDHYKLARKIRRLFKGIPFVYIPEDMCEHVAPKQFN